ncbi:hypothetical protein [Candidatus Nitrosotalea bavarica]|jgi:hypothetical protein|uniref:hypothetical protein n=1 Tax=Candidatus Nitrosotalea bavarica TaxID=1903277 RepID=UPI000C70AFCA|nr:hypothetical protein [Candidatus Nitrosotalea bavarica]
MDKRVFALGITMLVVGFGVYGYLSENEPAGKADMTDEEKAAFNQDLMTNEGLRNILGLVGGLGFLITLISIGIRGRKKGGAGKTVTQKPAEI